MANGVRDLAPNFEAILDTLTSSWIEWEVDNLVRKLSFDCFSMGVRTSFLAYLLTFVDRSFVSYSPLQTAMT